MGPLWRYTSRVIAAHYGLQAAADRAQPSLLLFALWKNSGTDKAHTAFSAILHAGNQYGVLRHTEIAIGAAQESDDYLTTAAIGTRQRISNDEVEVVAEYRTSGRVQDIADRRRIDIKTQGDAC